MSNQDHEATAKRILPCNCSHKLSEPHGGWCLSYYRPAVAAALAARDAELIQLRTEFIALERASIAETQECNQLRADWHELQGITEHIRAKLAAVEKERDDWKIAHAIEDEMGSRLVEQRDAAFKALNNLYDAVSYLPGDEYGDVLREAYKALTMSRTIAAEIAKAGKP